MQELWKHQKDIIERAKDRDHYAILSEPGTGKTRTMIEILRHKCVREQRILRTLIICPKVVCDNWREEFLKFSKIKKESIHILEGSGANRYIIIEDIYKNWERGSIVVCNYQTLLMDKVFEMLMKWRPEVMILDEAHRIKNPQAVTTKRADELSKVVANRYILTGTPILRSMLDVYSQWKVLDRGKTFGDNFFIFRNQYFYDKNAGKSWATWKEWVPRPHSEDMIKDQMKESASFVKKSDCLDLPPFIRKTISITLSSEQRRHYDQMHADLITYLGDKACVATIAITKALRLQQIVSGFMSVKLPDSNQDQIISFKENHRQDALKELLSDLIENNVPKIIVWACWKENYDHIRAVCEGLKIGYAELHGQCSDKQKKDALASFREDEGCVVLIGNQGAAGIGINLVEAPVAIYYSRNFSLEHDIQSEARNYRGGSERHATVVRYDLVTKSTIDELVLERLQEKKEIGDNILKFLGEYNDRRKETDSGRAQRKVSVDKTKETRT